MAMPSRPFFHAYFSCTRMRISRVYTRMIHRRGFSTLVLFIVVCVCRLVANSLLKGQFVLKTLSHTQRATKVKKFVGFSLKPLCCRDTALARCTATRAVGHFYPTPSYKAKLDCLTTALCKNADFLRNELFLAMHDQRFIWHIS